MKTNAFLQPLDRVAIALMLLLTFLIGLVLSQGDAVTARVRDFTWQNQIVGADDVSFSLTFSRPMEIKTVEDNLKIDPPLAGKFSWAGRRMVYTLNKPAPYGTQYTVKLNNALDKFAKQEGKNRTIQPFVGQFTTRDRVIVYVGTEGEELGRIVLCNLNKLDSKQPKQILTPKDLIAIDFKPYPNGEKILFSARTKDNPDVLSAQIYSVTTGISATAGKEPEPASRVELILDSKQYQNLKFDISPDGETIVVQRGNRNDPSDTGLWFMPASKEKSGGNTAPQRLKSEPSGDFTITPDSKAVAVSQGQGAAILPLQLDGSKPLDYLPQFGLVQAFSRDGSQAAMVKFNTDYTKELFLVTNQGNQKQLLKTTGSILGCQFDNASPTLYCLTTQLLPGDQYVEQPYIVAYDLKGGKQKPLVMMPAGQRNVQLNLAPDGLALLFDQVVAANDATAANSPLKTVTGEPIANSSLWIMYLQPISEAANPSDMKPEQLPLSGFHPRWLP